MSRELPVAPAGRAPAPAARQLLLVVHDDPSLALGIERDLRLAFDAEGYHAACVDSSNAALKLLDGLAAEGGRAALLVAPHEVAGESGVELIAAARGRDRAIRTILIVPHAQMRSAIDAVNAGSLDHFFIEPLEPADQQLIPVAADLLADWRRWDDEGRRGVRVVGPRASESVHELREFMRRSEVHHRFLDIQGDREAQRLLAERSGSTRLPLVVLEDGTRLDDPSPLELAEALGMRTKPQHAEYDLVIVGAGPAGLAGAVYGASEGLRTAVIESRVPGGQAGQSSKIENYLGFPSGVSGADLTRRAHRQSLRFDADVVQLREVAGLAVDDRDRVVDVRGATALRARTVLIACGVSYRRLDVPGEDRLVGRGVFYGAAMSDAQECAGTHVLIVGGANSAGQAALHFAGHAHQVTMLLRADSLDAAMSRYLVDRIRGTSNIEVRTSAEVQAVAGDTRLEAVTVTDRRTGATETVPAHGLFVFIGAVPRTDWLDPLVARDERGFVLSGRDLILGPRANAAWPLKRDPYLLETSMPGVFVAGDVRHGSIKRVASAVGEGAMAVQFVHQYLADEAHGP